MNLSSKHCEKHNLKQHDVYKTDVTTEIQAPLLVQCDSTEDLKTKSNLYPNVHFSRLLIQAERISLSTNRNILIVTDLIKIYFT